MQPEDVAERGDPLEEEAEDHRPTGADPVEDLSRRCVHHQPGEAVDREDEPHDDRRDAQQRAEGRERGEGHAATEPAEEDARDEATDDVADVRVIASDHKSGPPGRRSLDGHASIDAKAA